MRFRPTIRVRLAAWYAALFIVLGVGLLGLNYLLVRQGLVVEADDVRISVERRLGLGLDQLDPNQPATVLLRDIQRELTEETLRRLLLGSTIALGALAALSALTGWMVAGRVLRPVHEITATARRISETTLDARIGLQGPDDELKELADTFDALLARLERAFAAQRRFVAEASHELRTPLTLIRTELDVTMHADPVTPVELAEMAFTIRSAVARTERLIDSLLTLARSEGMIPVVEPVDLAELAAASVERSASEADRQQLKLEIDLQTSLTQGDSALLERVADNLIENAVVHNVDGGWMTIATGRQGRFCFLRVVNGGPILHPDEVDRLFEPFSRSRHAGRRPGFGLGLAIVRSVTALHDGRVGARPLPDGGLDVTVELPAFRPSEDFPGDVYAE